MSRRLRGVLRTCDARGKLSRPVVRQGSAEVMAALSTHWGTLELRLLDRGAFVLVAIPRDEERGEIIVLEDNLHALLDRAGLLPPEDLHAILDEAGILEEEIR